MNERLFYDTVYMQGKHIGSMNWEITRYKFHLFLRHCDQTNYMFNLKRNGKVVIRNALKRTSTMRGDGERSRGSGVIARTNTGSSRDKGSDRGRGPGMVARTKTGSSRNQGRDRYQGSGMIARTNTSSSWGQGSGTNRGSGRNG